MYMESGCIYIQDRGREGAGTIPPVHPPFAFVPVATTVSRRHRLLHPGRTTAGAGTARRGCGCLPWPVNAWGDRRAQRKKEQLLESTTLSYPKHALEYLVVTCPRSMHAFPSSQKWLEPESACRAMVPSGGKRPTLPSGQLGVQLQLLLRGKPAGDGRGGKKILDILQP